jgi:hypothetical protein
MYVGIPNSTTQRTSGLYRISHQSFVFVACNCAIKLNEETPVQWWVDVQRVHLELGDTGKQQFVVCVTTAIPNLRNTIFDSTYVFSTNDVHSFCHQSQVFGTTLIDNAMFSWSMFYLQVKACRSCIITSVIEKRAITNFAQCLFDD